MQGIHACICHVYACWVCLGGGGGQRSSGGGETRDVSMCIRKTLPLNARWKRDAPKCSPCVYLYIQ